MAIILPLIWPMLLVFLGLGVYVEVRDHGARGAWRNYRKPVLIYSIFWGPTFVFFTYWSVILWIQFFQCDSVGCA